MNNVNLSNNDPWAISSLRNEDVSVASASSLYLLMFASSFVLKEKIMLVQSSVTVTAMVEITFQQISFLNSYIRLVFCSPSRHVLINLRDRFPPPFGTSLIKLN